MKRTCLAVALAATTFVSMHAQSANMPPFVSRFTVVGDEQGVILSWQDSDEADGAYYVYRHTEEIDAVTFPEATLVENIAKGTEAYIDKPTTEGPHYYAVLASNSDGTIHEIFIPYRNKTTRGLRVSFDATENVPLQPITDISARVAENVVIIDYLASIGEDVVIYRSTDPIASKDDLVGAVLVDTLVSSKASYSDRPMAGIRYYYGIFYDEELRTGNPVFNSGENILLLPVSIALEEVETTTIAVSRGRVRPLPYLMLSSTVDTGERLKASPYDISVAAGALSDKTQEAVNRLLSKKKEDNPVAKESEWLNGDKNDGPLFALLRDLFEERQWTAALFRLDSYMQTRRTEDETERAYFYKGQCYYYLGEYEQSFVHFIFAEDSYYPQVQPWLDEIIARLASL